jgi:hypothetical protein
MIQVVRGPLEICRGVGQRCRLGCGERGVGVFGSSPRPPWKTPAKCCPRPSETAQDGDQHLPPSLPPARELVGLGGVGQVDNSPQFKQSARRKGRAIPEIVWRQRSRFRFLAVSWCCRRRAKKTQGVMAWEAFMTGPWGPGRSECRERPARKTVADADLRARC